MSNALSHQGELGQGGRGAGEQGGRGAEARGRDRLPSSPAPRLPGSLLAGLVLLAAAIRLYFGLRPRIVWGDEPFYLWLGQSLLDGGGYQFFGISGVHFSPLFPLLAGLIGKLAGNLATGSVVLYVVCGALLVAPIYGMARRLAGAAAGIAAGVAAAFSPPLVAAVPLWGTMTEPLFLLCVATAWWGLLIALEEGRLRGYVAAGAGLGLAYLTRTEALVYLVAGLGALLLLRLAAPHPAIASPAVPGTAPLPPRPRAPVLPGLAVALAIFALVISPYLVALYAKTGQWQLAEEAGSTYVSARGLAYGDVAAFDAATWGLDAASGEVYLFAPSSESQGLLAAILADVRGFARLVRNNVYTLLATTFSSRLIPWPLAALALLGLFGRPWDRRRLRGELLLLASVAGPLSFVLFFIQPRYLAGLLIPALVWIGEGTAHLGEWLGGTWQRMAADKRMQLTESGGAGEQGSRGAEVLPGSSALKMTLWRRTRGFSRFMPPTSRPAKASSPGDRFSSAVASTAAWKTALLIALPALALAVALLWQAPRVWAATQQTRSFQPGHALAAAELRARGAPADAVVMSRYPAIAFHAGTRWAPTPAATWPEVAAYARSRGARYLVVDAWEVSLRPKVRALLDPAAAPADLRHVATVEAGAGPVVIYEFR